MHAVTNPLAAASTPRAALDAPAGRRVRASRAVTKILATANSRDDDDSQNASTSQPSSSGMLGRRATVAGAAAALFSIARGASSSARAESIGESLLERRRVEEGAKRAELEQLYAELKEEEARVKALRFEEEEKAMTNLNARRIEEEQKARQQVIDGKTLCITPFGIDVVGITEAVALVGAIGAGLTSNARKAEIAELNEKLRTINVTLRQQVRDGQAAASRSGSGGIYPDGGGVGKGARTGGASAIANNVVDQGANDQGVSAQPMDSLDAEDELASAGAGTKDFNSESVRELKEALRGGRRLLTEGDENSFRESEKLFEKALMLSRMVGDVVQVRRAVRGLAASKRGRNDYKGAIAGLKEVLSISDQLGDHVGDADALGSIADMYTEMGDLENAGRYYDMYLDALNKELSM